MCAKRVKRGTDGWRLALFSSLTTWVVGQISRDFANHFYKVHGAGCFFPLFFCETGAVFCWGTPETGNAHAGVEFSVSK